jgi:phage terminase large subunit GpA-like protein
MPIPDARTELLRAAAQAVLPDPELRLDEWSEQNVVVPKGSAFAGPYRLSHTPYARRILQALSPGHPAARIVAMVASQMLKTQVFICAALGWMHSAPANILALEPTDGLAKRLSARVSKSVEACHAMDGVIAPPRSRDKRNTIDAKEFDGGTLYITTAGAEANLAEIAARYLFCDEVDRKGWESEASGEGDKVKLAEARLTTYEGISKAYEVSSPTILGASKIHSLFLQGTQERYHVPCPHCGHLHELVRENFKYHVDEESGRVEYAHFVCPECGSIIEEHDKATMLPDVDMGGQARWVPTAEGDGETISVTLSSYYAPLGSITWIRLAKELHQAEQAKERGDDSLLQVYENTREGIPHQPGEVTSTARELQKRAKDEGLPARVVPDRALVLTMYADTQPDRLEVAVEAWGPGLERWTIDHQVLWGSPTDAPELPGSVWQRFDAIRRTPFAHASGSLIRISAWGLDSGGANTQDVYNFGSAYERFGCLVTKGASIRGKPIIASKPTLQDIDWQGKRVEDGVRLWTLGTDTAKDNIFSRIRLPHGPGAMHWYASMELDLFEQLLAEKPHVRYIKGRPIREYIKPNGARNELLDIAVGNLAMAYYLGLHKWSATDWQRLRDNLVGRASTPDLFATAAVRDYPTAPPEPPPAHLQRPEAASPPSQPPAAPPAPIKPATPAPPPSGRRVLSKGIR